jgi:hypothetical protein
VAANWIVRVKYAGKVTEGWDYEPNYFPRTFPYKDDAETCAEEARRKGGRNISTVKENGTTPTKERTNENNSIRAQESRYHSESLSPAIGH